MSKDYEEAIEAVTRKFIESEGFRAVDMAREVLSLKWPDGSPMIGVLAQDRSLPNPAVKVRGNYNVGYSTARLDMLNEGFCRIAPNAL